MTRSLRRRRSFRKRSKKLGRSRFRSAYTKEAEDLEKAVAKAAIIIKKCNARTTRRTSPTTASESQTQKVPETPSYTKHTISSSNKVKNP